MEKIIIELREANCIKEGTFQLRNGEYSKYYFDMKNLISYPKLLSKIGDSLWNIINEDLKKKNILFDNLKICGVPLGGLPISTYISTKHNIPMIMVRDKVKNYGTQKQIEGEYNNTDNCIIIEDVITTGGSVNETLEILKGKINVIGIGVILNRSNIEKIENINIYNLMNINDFN